MNRSPSSPELRIILPVHRDREAVLSTLNHLLSRGWRAGELRVVTAGEPETAAAVREQGVEALDLAADRKGRARQMNAGAAAGGGDLLVFLHADTRLPAGARGQLESAWRAGKVGGGFRRRFDSPSRFLRLTCRLADLRGRVLGWYFGDQTLWVRRDVFEALGGFPDLDSFEDLEFSRRLRSRGPTALLPGPTLSSARRFTNEGPWRRTWRDVGLTWRHFFGK